MNATIKPDWEQAAVRSYYERWLPICKAKNINKMEKIYCSTKCAMCINRDKIVGNNDCKKAGCSIHQGVALFCCIEFTKWRCAYIKGDFTNALKSAKRLADELCRIGKIDAWEHRIQQSQQPQFKVGELVVCPDNILCKIERISEHGTYQLRRLFSGAFINWGEKKLTPLSPGVKFRAKCKIRGLPDVSEFVIVDYRPVKKGDICINYLNGYIVAIATMDYMDLPTDSSQRWIVLPLALDYWTFEIEGVECVAYETDMPYWIQIARTGSSLNRGMWIRSNSKDLFSDIMNNVAADYEREHGRPLPIIPAEYVDVILKGE